MLGTASARHCTRVVGPSEFPKLQADRSPTRMFDLGRSLLSGVAGLKNYEVGKINRRAWTDSFGCVLGTELGAELSLLHAELEGVEVLKCAFRDFGPHNNDVISLGEFSRGESNNCESPGLLGKGS